jgi:hypothetical protein
MGLLDEAIREHLDLKRRRGADPTEVDQLEHEALGPVRRGQQVSDEALQEEEHFEGERHFDHEGQDEHVDPEPFAQQGPFGEDEPLADEHPPERNGLGTALYDDEADELPAQSSAQPAPAPAPAFADEPPEPTHEERSWSYDSADTFEAEESRGPAEPGPPADESPAAPPPEHPAPPPPPARAERPAPPPEPSEHAGQETVEYDVEAEHDRERTEDDPLEETPEFLQDTPDHDRLWFEQRPPRPFDFDK